MADFARPRPCPICDGAQSRLLHRQCFAQLDGGGLLDGYDVVVCRQCGFAFADGIPGQEFFDTYYHGVALETPDCILITADERYLRAARAKGRNWQRRPALKCSGTAIRPSPLGPGGSPRKNNWSRSGAPRPSCMTSTVTASWTILISWHSLPPTTRCCARSGVIAPRRAHVPDRAFAIRDGFHLTCPPSRRPLRVQQLGAVCKLPRCPQLTLAFRLDPIC